MSDAIPLEVQTAPPISANWSAVFSLSLTVSCFVTAELLPISLLTPIAADLGVTEGMAGQAVSVTSVVAMVTSLVVAAVTRRLDRRVVLMLFTILFAASNLLVGFASDYVMLLAGRLLLGVALGGFWSMAGAFALRLVPEAMVPRALSIVFGGISVAMVIAAPLGSFLGDVIGWRGVFLCTAVIGVITLIWQLNVLPVMPPAGESRLSTLFGLLRRRQVVIGTICLALVFGGHFGFLTYLRPFLETITKVDVGGVSGILLGFGLGNIVGNALSGTMIRRGLRLTLAAAPLLMSGLAFSLVAFGSYQIPVAILVAGWGFAFGLIPTPWTTWTTRTVPDEPESAGGLQVAAIQLAITAGAGVGGMILDASGALGVITVSGIILLMAAGVVFTGLRETP